MFDPCEHFKDFYTNPIIQSIQYKPKWTVSDANKMPIDMYGIITEHKIMGALFTDEKSLVPLTTVCKVIPDAANNTFYLDSLIDGFVVLDIEPKCPDDLKTELLKLPYLYGEVSMSGKGYHLLFRLPDCISEYPVAQQKIVMKEEHGYYEILMNHYVTFTRNSIPLNGNTNEKDFETLFRQLASVQKETIKNGEFDVSIEAPNDIPAEDIIISTLIGKPYNKTPADFNGDTSRYEYGYIGFLHFNLKRILSIPSLKDRHMYTDNEKAWLIYKSAQEVIPYRSKHDENRCQLPWLLYLAKDCIEKDTTTPQHDK